MMSYLLHLSIAIIVSIRLCLTLEFNDLNICDTQTQLTVKHAFRFQDKFVAFVKINNSSDTVYAIKVNGFQPSVAYHKNYERYENYTFELIDSNSAELWNDWNVNVNDSVEHELENFEDVFVREDQLVHYVVYLKSGRYYKAEYDSNFTRIKFVHASELANSGDELQIAVHDYFSRSDDRYVTTMLFPRDIHFELPELALIYQKTPEHSNNQFSYSVFYVMNITEWNEWGKSSKALDLNVNETTKIVSAFYITNYYKSVNENVKHFFMIEISANGGFKVKQITTKRLPQNPLFISVDLKLFKDIYNRTIRQLFQCPLLTISSTASTISISNTPKESSTNTMSTVMSTNTVPNNNKWLYIIAAIILLLIITAIIVGVWCCCSRRNKKSDESEENGSKENDEQLKSIPEEEETVRSDTDVDSSDTAIPSQTESEANPSGVSPQSESQSPKDV